MLIEPVSDERQIEVIERLACKIWNEHFIPVIGKAQVDYMLDKYQSRNAITEQIINGYLYYLFGNNNHSIGYMGVLPEGQLLFLSKLYIASEERGKGYGRMAIEFLEELAVQKGVSKITLTVNRNNTDTIKVYKRLGFVSQGTIVQDIGNGFVMDDYKMEKEVFRAQC